jgi:hypothetical protein
MRKSLVLCVPILSALAACGTSETARAPVQPEPASVRCPDVNTLTAAEQAAGWQLLFDGKSTSGWHGYNGKPTGAWIIEDCALKTVGTQGNYGSDQRADLVSDREFENFELSLDWKASKGGNSGVMYAVVESPKYQSTFLTGPEYQLIDDVGFPEKLQDWQKAGADYAMYDPPANKNLKPVGEWNNTRIVVNGTHVEYWLNGQQLFAFERWSDDWKRRKDEGKWKDAAEYGMAKKGRIALQDHGSVFWFRNIKIRGL